MNLTISDSDTFLVNSPSGAQSYQVEGTASYMKIIENEENGRVAEASGDGYVNILNEYNVTNQSSHPDSYIEGINYYALYYTSVSYPAVTEMQYQVYDSAPTSDPASPGHTIHDSDAPLLQKDLTVTYGAS